MTTGVRRMSNEAMRGYSPLGPLWRALVSLAVFPVSVGAFAADESIKDHCNGAAADLEPTQHGWFWTWENDVVSAIKSDKYYTQGAQVGYTFENDRDDPGFLAHITSPLCRLLGFNASGDGAKVLGARSLFIGQQLFTPRDTESLDPIPNDRPYAGWAHLGLRLELLQPLANSDRKGAIGHRRWRTHTLELQAGVVGESARGEETQRAAHDISDSNTVSGWRNQIDDRFGGQAFYNFSTRWGSLEVGKCCYGLMGDWLFAAGGAAGNLQQYAELGMVARLGRNMGPMAQRAIVPSALTASQRSNDANVLAQQAPNLDTEECGFLFRAKECYVFVGAAARGVRKNIFLEPALSGAGAEISPDHFVYELTWGVRARYSWARFDYISTTRSREFKPAPANPFDGDGRHDFGSFTMTCYGEFGGYSGSWQFLCPGIVTGIVGFLVFR